MSDIIFNLSMVGLVLVMIIISIILLSSMRINRRTILLIWCFFIISLATFAYFADPSFSDDLYRYYLTIDRIRSGIPNTSFEQSPLLVQKIWFLLVAKTENNGWLPATAVLLFGYFIGCIANDYMKKNQVTTRIIILFFLACLGCCSVFNLISGVRNVVAFSLWYYGYYFWGKHRKILYYIVAIVAALLHTAVIICIGLALIYEYYLKANVGKEYIKAIIVIAVIAYMLQSPLIGSLLSTIPNTYTNLMAQKWNYYLQYEGVMGETGAIFVTLIVLFFTMSAIYLIIKRKGEISFSEFILSISLPMSLSNIIFERFVILIGIVSLPTLDNVYKSMSKLSRIFYFTCTLVLLSMRIFLSFYSMFVYMKFNGNIMGDFWRSILGG